MTLRNLLFLVAVLAGSLVRADEKPAGYLFTSFRGSGDGLHLAYSFDAMDWTELKRVFLKPEVGSKLLRDPHILKGPDGLFHMVWTSGWHDKGIGYATSKDLLEWSDQRFLPLTGKIDGVETTWAPELYWLEGEQSYLIVWSSAVPMVGKHGAQHRAWYSLTKDFKLFSEPQILFDPGFNNIDTTLVEMKGKYVLFLKETDDQEKGVWGAIRSAIADKPLGPYRLLKEPVIEKERAEGPAAVVMDGRATVYFDYYVEHRYGARRSGDLKRWQDVTGGTHVVEGQRHGSILPVSAEVLAGVRGEEKEAIASVPKRALDQYTADPSIRAFGDTYYIYPTSDRPNWNTFEFAAWSSKNLVDWKKEGVFLDLRKDIDWADVRAWAPDCIERGGRYYFYFCGDGKIGVAVGDSPTGPFKDALGKPLLKRGGKVHTNTIDPCAFIDDDGQAYLYFGNGQPCQVYQLKKDMIHLDGDPVDLQLRDFREGIVVFKRKGKYYFMWSIDDARSPNYRVGWGWSDTPTGPVESPHRDFIVLQKNGNAVATAHHGVVNVPGTDRWFVAYHRHAVPGGGGYKREVAIVEMKFDDEGRILPMDPLDRSFEPGTEGVTIPPQH
ncbi:family 43 glycosylhydrolase [Haloferula sargassicola]|uniref:Glycosyl hydrolases family 43 n=1 Tax=Haloferula sargassicola TaxID=490096 RepID=A0ABP9UNL5_9BACT